MRVSADSRDVPFFEAVSDHRALRKARTGVEPWQAAIEAARRFFAYVLIRVKLHPGTECINAAMGEDSISSNEVACPVCSRPVTLQIIRRSFVESLYAFEFKPCGLSMIGSESSPPPSFRIIAPHFEVNQSNFPLGRLIVNYCLYE